MDWARDTPRRSIRLGRRLVHAATFTGAILFVLNEPMAQNGENTSPALELAIPLFTSASNPNRQGFARIINHSKRAGEVDIEAYDDEGQAHGPLTLSMAPGETVHFNSGDLENGNPGKGLAGSTGQGQGDWRLVLTSGLDIEVLSYVRTSDGFLTAMHDTTSVDGGRHKVATFNPGSNRNQESLLRLSNLGDAQAEVSVAGVDDEGRSPGAGASVTISAGASRTYTAAELESGDGAGLEGSLGDGKGKWRLTVESSGEIAAMSLLSSPTGHLTNLSTVPNTEADATHRIPLFPAASDANGRQGFARVINRSDTAGSVTIRALDDTDREYEALTLAIGANEAKHFNSNDLELGNDDKGLTGSTGAGEGDWRLSLSSDLEIDVLSYVRTDDGFLTAMHDMVPPEGTRHHVAVFNPGSNINQASRLRLVNEGESVAQASIVGIDDAGATSGSVSLSVPASSSRSLTAQELETGGAGFDGMLGDGAGKWRLVVESTPAISVMSLLSSPTGHLTNLSTARARDFSPADDAVFRDRFQGGWVVAREPESRVTFQADGRFSMTDASGSRGGTYVYTRTGRNEADVVLDFEDGNSCTYKLAFASRLAGRHSYTCDDGQTGEAAWHADGTLADTTPAQSPVVSQIDLDPDNDARNGIAYADGVLYAPEYRKVYAYTLPDERNADRDFDLDNDIRDPERLAYADGRLYLLDEEDARVYAYSTDGHRAMHLDFDLDSRHIDPDGIGYADGRFYVVDELFSPDRVFVYTASGERVPDADFDLHDDNGGAVGIAHANGRLFVVDTFDEKVFAYTFSGERIPDLDFALHEDNDSPGGIAYGNRTFYVRDRGVIFAYSYEAGAAVLAPDLLVDVPAINRSVVSGTTLTLRATVRNRGDDDAPATTLRYYRSTDPTVEAGDTEVGTRAVAGSAAGTASDHMLDVLAPTAPGTYYYGACADAVHGEWDTANNCSAGMGVEVVDGGGPDLVAELPAPAGDVSARYSFRLVGAVRNRGDAVAEPTVLRYYQSSDATVTRNDTEVAAATVGRLEAGSSAEHPVRITASSEAGTYYYGVCVDAVGGESDTGNNCSPGIEVAVTNRVEACAFDLDEENDRAAGIAHASGILYVANGYPRKVFAYTTSGERDADSDFDLDGDNRNPHRIATGNRLLYVVDDSDDKVYAYTTSGDRDEGADFDLVNDDNDGIAFADGRFYLLDRDRERVVAYMASGEHDTASDFELDPYNSGPVGITHADARFFVVDDDDRRVYAYGTAGERDASLDFDLHPDNVDSAGIAYDGARFHVVDESAARVFIYPNREAAADAQPCFREGAATTRAIPENTPPGIDVGDPVTATGGDALRYTLAGDDAASFDIVAETGQIRTREGIVYDYETKSRYLVEVGVGHEDDSLDTIDVTIDLIDLFGYCPFDDELALGIVSGDGRLTVLWDPLPAPEMGYARTQGYETEIRRGFATPWTDRRTFIGRDIGGTVYADLDNDTEYEVRVRTINAERDCSWTWPVSGTPTGDLAPKDDREHFDRFGPHPIGDRDRQYRLLVPGRCRHTLAGDSLDADCTYERTAPDAGRIVLEFDDPSKGSCEVTLAYSSLTAGSFVDECFDAGVNTNVPFDRSFRMPKLPDGGVEAEVPRAPRTQEEFEVFAWRRADLVPGLVVGCFPAFENCDFGSGQAYTIGRDLERGVPLFILGKISYENTGPSTGKLVFREDGGGDSFEIILEFEPAGSVRATISATGGTGSEWPGMPHLDLTLGAQTVLLPIPPSWSAAIAIESDLSPVDDSALLQLIPETSGCATDSQPLMCSLLGDVWRRAFVGPDGVETPALVHDHAYRRIGPNRGQVTVDWNLGPSYSASDLSDFQNELLDSTWDFDLTFVSDDAADYVLAITKGGRLPTVNDGFADFTGDGIVLDGFPEELEPPDEAPQASGEDAAGVEVAAAVSAGAIASDDLQILLVSASGAEFEPGDWLEPKDGGNQRMMIVSGGEASVASAPPADLAFSESGATVKKRVDIATGSWSRFRLPPTLRTVNHSMRMTSDSHLIQITAVCMQSRRDIPIRGARFFSKAKAPEGAVQLCQKDCVLEGGDNIQGCVWACD